MTEYTNAEKADMILAHGATDCKRSSHSEVVRRKASCQADSCSYHVCSPTPAIMWDRFSPEGSTYRIERGNCTRYGRDHSQFKYTRPFHSVTCSNELQIPFFEASVLFTDEASFSREGIFNTHNSHSWAAANPHVTRTRAAQDRFLVNVWADILGDHLIGPLHSAWSPDWSTLPDISWNKFCQSYWTEHTLPLRLVLPCGSSKVEPPHISVFLFESLDALCGERWIGRGGPVH
ncbi:transposase-like protein [Trichonephila clavipes]|nr:transposase-like protein [Trichonephila clavipes]